METWSGLFSFSWLCGVVVLVLVNHMGACGPLPLELEYFQTVKQTFGVPGSLRTGDQQMVAGETGRGFDVGAGQAAGAGVGASEAELESAVTVFSFTIVIVTLFGVILVAVLSYFIYSFVSSFVQFLARRREKRERLSIIRASSTSSTDETETSSLDSLSFQ